MTFIKRGIKTMTNKIEAGVATVGSKAQVFHGTAMKTAGGLLKGDLFKGKDGKIKSKKASAAAKKNGNLGTFKKGKGSKFELSPKRGSVEYNNKI